MIKYYIKDGFGEKGPMTIDEIKKHGIARTAFIRQADSTNWVQLDTIPELQKKLKKDKSVLKISGIIAIVFTLIIAVGVIIKNINLNSSYEPYTLIEEPDAIPPPPSIEFQVTKHTKKFSQEIFKDCNLTGAKKQLMNACNYTNASVRNTAVNIAGQSPGTFNLGQICDIFDYCYNNWKYVNDPKAREVVEYASTTLSNGLNGDCDDFAVLLCSMILSIGGEARINYAYGADGGHAFTEVNIGRTDKHEINNYISKRYKRVYNRDGIWSRTDSKGNKWLNLDWFAKHPGGKYFDYRKGTSFYIIQEFCDDFTK